MADFQRLETEAAGETLLERNPLPANFQAWQRIGRSASRLPTQLAAGFVKAGQEVRTKVALASRDQRGLAIAAVLGLLLGALLLRHLLHSRLIAGQSQTALATPAAAIRDSILFLVPAAVWWLMVYVFGLTRETTLLIGGLLAIWPVVAFVLLLARRRAFPRRPRGPGRAPPLLPQPALDAGAGRDPGGAGDPDQHLAAEPSPRRPRRTAAPCCASC